MAVLIKNTAAESVPVLVTGTEDPVETLVTNTNDSAIPVSVRSTAAPLETLVTNHVWEPIPTKVVNTDDPVPTTITNTELAPVPVLVTNGGESQTVPSADVITDTHPQTVANLVNFPWFASHTFYTSGSANLGLVYSSHLGADLPLRTSSNVGKLRFRARAQVSRSLFGAAGTTASALFVLLVNRPSGLAPTNPAITPPTRGYFLSPAYFVSNDNVGAPYKGDSLNSSGVVYPVGNFSVDNYDSYFAFPPLYASDASYITGSSAGPAGIQCLDATVDFSQLTIPSHWTGFDLWCYVIPWACDSTDLVTRISVLVTRSD